MKFKIENNMFIKCLHFYQLIEYIEKYNIIVDLFIIKTNFFLINYVFVIKQIINFKTYKLKVDNFCIFPMTIYTFST